MRKVMQIFRIRKIGRLLLVLLALVAIFPVFFSVTGSLMGQKELNDLLGAVLTADSGSASGQAVSYVFWRVLPLYPTLRSYVKVLLDSPEFFGMFWNSVKITVGVLAGQILVGVPAAWGFARYRFPGKNLLFMIYVALMMMPFQVMMLSNNPEASVWLWLPHSVPPAHCNFRWKPHCYNFPVHLKTHYFSSADSQTLH